MRCMNKRCNGKMVRIVKKSSSISRGYKCNRCHIERFVYKRKEKN